MSTIDLARHTTDFRKHYAGVRMQQGKVLCEEDLNEAWRLDLEDMRRTRMHVIGPAGAPDGGFRVSNPIVAGGVADFTIEAGTFYLGGHRLQMDAPETYRTQKDWLRLLPSGAITLPSPGTTRLDLIWIEGWQQGVTAVEDGELFEVALSGPDTAGRLRTMRRVHVAAGVGEADCKAAWSNLVGTWTAEGTLSAEAELATDALLTVGLDPAGAPPADLCTPPSAGGYLGALNQAIRVQLVDANSFTWSYDNASPLYRVRVRTEGGVRRKVEMLTPPFDQEHWPLAGQIVEFLPWSAVLPNRLGPGGTMDRCEKLGELSGHLARVDGSYSPTTKGFTIAAANALSAAFGDEWQARPDAAELGTAAESYLYMRVWNRGSDTASPLAIPFVPGTPVVLQNTGLQVTITGSQRRKDLHWIIGARPETPQQVTPWQLDAGRPPHGYRLWRTPLAIVRWQADGAGNVTGQVIDDCRDPFLPLTKIRSCCRYTVGDGVNSHGHFSRIQDAIDALPLEGGEVCVLPGTYRESVAISGKQNISLHGCGRRSRIVPPASPNGVAGPGLQIIGSHDIQVERLAIIAQPTAPGLRVAPAPLSRELYFEELYIEAGPSSGVEIAAGRFVSLYRCEIHQRDRPGPFHAVFTAADDVWIEHNWITVDAKRAKPGFPFPELVDQGRGGLQIGGGSERVRVIDNLIEGGIGHGITLGHLIATGGEGGGIVVTWPVDPDDPCDPCKPGDVVIDEDPGTPPRFESGGALYDIRIERNRIRDMGLCGIGVVGFFRRGSKQLISVDGLVIIGNDILRCLRRSLANVPDAIAALVGYGGIALADADRLVIRDNVIVDNGRDHLEPVCGIFVMTTDDVEVSRNRISNNGAKTAEPTSSAKAGSRGGIVIAAAFASAVGTTAAAAPSADPAGGLAAVVPRARPRDLPAARIHENTVAHPLGRALLLNAVGPVSVQGNRLVSEGVGPRPLDRMGSAVWILNLGISSELPARLLGAAFGGLVQVMNGTATGTLGVTCADARTRRSGDRVARGFWPSGNTLFTDNQVALDLLGSGRFTGLASILIGSLDDIGFHDDQCEMDLDDQVYVTNAFLIGMTVRMSDCRLAEGWVNAAYSAFTFGFLNATTNNQSTHCIFATAFRPDLLVRTGNVALLSAFCPDLCGRLREG